MMSDTQLGDLFIHLTVHSANVFLIGRDRHHPQVTYRTYLEALHYAKRAAARFDVDVWITKDGATFQRVVEYRTDALLSRLQ